MYDDPLKVAIIAIILFLVLLAIFSLVTYVFLKFASESILFKKR